MGSVIEVSPPPAVVVAALEGDRSVLEQMADEWQSLCEEGPSSQPFYRPEWVLAYLRVFEPASRLVVCTARAGGKLLALLPLIRETRFLGGLPARILRGPANDHSCRFDMVRAPGPQGDAGAAAIWECLKTSAGWDAIELPYVCEGATLNEVYGRARGEGFPTAQWLAWRTAYIPLTGPAPKGLAPWLGETSSQFRHTVHRTGRRLEEKGPVTFRRIDTADPAALRVFYELEQSGWKGAEATAIICDPRITEFYNEVAAARVQRPDDCRPVRFELWRSLFRPEGRL